MTTNGLLKEYEIMLNPALGALALAAFSSGFLERNHSISNKITLHHILTILPLVFNASSRRVILKKQERSGLRSILNQDKQLGLVQNESVFNINGRIFSFQKRTFRSLNIALSSGLLTIQDGYFYPLRDFPTKDALEETQQIILAARKLGRWAGSMTVIDYLTTLEVRVNEARNLKIDHLAN